MNNIYQDIAKRTQGDIYIGVVGPVRTGKSTFIKNFMDLMVIPNIQNEYKRERAMDELPQSAGGKTIMTTEPKFIPNEAIEINIDDTTTFKVRLIDCVGYIINNVLGHIENDAPRLVVTPWSNTPIPFTEAAEIGTKKVITEHSTVGIVVTTDGSITDIDRNDYVEAEARVISELKQLDKPFVVLLNTTNPYSESTLALKDELENKYNVSVIPVNCMDLSMNDISNIMENILAEFPIHEIGYKMPTWLNELDKDYWLKNDLLNNIISSTEKIKKVSECKAMINLICDCDYIEKAFISNTNMGEGNVEVNIILKENIFIKVLNEKTGFSMSNHKDMFKLLSELSEMKKSYDKIEYALQQVRQKGYGIVSPTIDELTLEEPEIVKQGSRFGVKLRASAPSIHMICNKQKCITPDPDPIAA